MIQQPPRSTRTETHVPYTTLLRSHPVDRRLTRGGIGLDVAGISLLDLIISYTRVGERETDRLLGHHVPVLAVAWLGEGDHPHACNTHLGHCRTPPSRPVYKLRATISFMISLAPP